MKGIISQSLVGCEWNFAATADQGLVRQASNGFVTAPASVVV